MVKLGFVVEGDSEKLLIESENFRDLARKYNIAICDPVINAGGGGNLCRENLHPFIQECRKINPDRIFILTDLECEPCFEQTKKRIDNSLVDTIIIARKALESWFIADSEAMSALLQHSYYCDEPESTAGMPWEYLKSYTSQQGIRGPGATRLVFARKMINSFHFSIERAAQHPQCPSARYFLHKLQALGADKSE